MRYVHGAEQGVDIQAATSLRSEGNGGRLRLGKLSADIAADAETAALIRVLGLLAEEPPSLGGPRDHALMDSPFHQECRRVQL